MFKITLAADRAEPDMAAVASAFGISVSDLEDDIRIGMISRWFEVGEGTEDNKPHQIFVSSTLGIRVEVDEHGNVRSANEYEAVSAVLQPLRTKDGEAGDSKEAPEKTLTPVLKEKSDTVRKARLDALLDEALEQSFPASDPIAICFASPESAARS